MYYFPAKNRNKFATGSLSLSLSFVTPCPCFSAKTIATAEKKVEWRDLRNDEYVTTAVRQVDAIITLNAPNARYN